MMGVCSLREGLRFEPVLWMKEGMRRQARFSFQCGIYDIIELLYNLCVIVYDEFWYIRRIGYVTHRG